MVADVLPFVRSCTVDGPGESHSAPCWSLGGKQRCVAGVRCENPRSYMFRRSGGRKGSPPPLHLTTSLSRHDVFQLYVCMRLRVWYLSRDELVGFVSIGTRHTWQG